MKHYTITYTRQYDVSALSEDDAISQVEEIINSEISAGDFLVSEGDFDIKFEKEEDENTSESILNFDTFSNKNKK